VVWGDESKRPLILIHGSRDHARSWDFVAEALLDRYAVYAPDLRGHGDSEWAVGGQYEIIDYVVDLAKMVEVMARGPVTLVAHSLGGGVAIQYAGAFPDRVAKLVVVEGLAPGIMRDKRPADERLRDFVRRMRDLEASRGPRPYATIEEAADRMQEANRGLSRELALHLARHGSRRNEDGYYVWKHDNHMVLRSPHEWSLEDGRAFWSAITCPVLLINGSKSSRQDPSDESWTSAFRDMRRVVVEDSDHWVHHDQRDAFLRVVNEFLSE
jgi:pimeloyl-ACP methyl ester carboxylesterase